MKKMWHEISGNFSHGEVELLQRLTEGKVVVEVGTFYGRSLAAIAEKAMLVYSVDTFRAHPNGQTQMQYYTTLKETQENLRGYNNVTFLPGESDDIAPTFDNESIDTCFIDGFHYLEWIFKDAIFWYSKIKVGGIMAFHDAFIYPGVNEVCNKIFGRIDGQASSVIYAIKKGNELITSGQYIFKV